jgi:hypothetical protein
LASQIVCTRPRRNAVIGIDPLADESEPSSATAAMCDQRTSGNSRISMTPRNSGCGKRAQGEAAADSVTVDRRNNRFVHLEHAGILE